MQLYNLPAKSLFFSLLVSFLCISCEKSTISNDTTESNMIAGRELALTSKHLFRFIRNDKFGYINEQGKIVIPAQFSRADNFSEGLAGVEVGGKYGMIDQTGKIVIKPVYEFIYAFKNGQAKFIGFDQKAGFIDRTGKIIQAATSERNFYATPAPLMADNSSSDGENIDQQSTSAIKPKFEYTAAEFHEGLAWVMVNKKLGYADKQGKIVIEPQFTNNGGCCNGDFHQGLARVHQNGKSGYIDKTGKIVVPIKFDRVAPEFQEGLAWVVANKKLGFVDRSGKIVVPLQFDYQSMSKDGRAGVTVCNSHYCFSSESTFKNGLAAVKTGQDYKYIDKTGKVVFDSRK
jgi:WG containing repeat